MAEKQREHPAETLTGQERCLRFLYECVPGRVLLRLLRARWVSHTVGAYMNSPLSSGRARRTARAWKVDPAQFEGDILRSYNAFFTRKRKEPFSPSDGAEDALLSPADSRLTIVPLRKGTAFPVKQAPYTVAQLLGNTKQAKREAQRYENGYAFVFRLSVEDYHRYSYPDDGVERKHWFLRGTLHTVNPIALEKLPVFHRNCREVTLLDCKRFGRIACVEVGAMLVGKIVNRHPRYFFRGEEKGYFEFGGSTVVLLVGPGKVLPERKLLLNSLAGKETYVRLGQAVGRAIPPHTNEKKTKNIQKGTDPND
ncbi:MAG: phosphatidylserine decarboxylase [Oscillospiraceae bacterium]|nr:phosphatidylserine decarboxylase [Oscillospiraceae bacterium]